MAGLMSGCLGPSSSARPPSFALNEEDARRAGALALYSKGLLLESEAGKNDTNAVRDAALQAFQNALCLEPDNRRVLAALLSNLTDRERFAEAFAAAETYLKRHPEDLELQLEAARVAEAAERPNDAARHCLAILAAQPDNRELASALVRLYFQAHRDRAALALIRAQHVRFKDRASAALPVQWAVYFTREGRQPALALRCLDLALEQRTNATERAALTTLAAESQLLLGQTNAAMTSLSKAYEENPSATAPLVRLGTLWAQRPNATNLLARRVHSDKKPETSLLILAATQQALGDSAGAIASLRDFRERRVRAGTVPVEDYYLWIGGLLDEQKQSGETEGLLLEALAKYPDSHEIKNFLAYFWAERNVRLDEANRLVNEALQADADNGAYLDTKGWILFKSGRLYDALQFLLRAAERDKDEPEILDHVGDVLKAAGRESEAISFWTRSYQCEANPEIAGKLRKVGADVPSAP